MPIRRVSPLVPQTTVQLKSSETDLVPELFDGSDRFDRWRFLQDLLEGDADADVVNQLLFQVLEGALKYPRPNGEGEVSPLSPEIKEPIERILSESSEGRVAAMVEDFEDETNKESLLQMIQRLEELLPTLSEDEDAVKSLWDTVMQLNGRESVKYHETVNPTLEWKMCNTVTRLLLDYDFLTLGVVKSPIV